MKNKTNQARAREIVRQLNRGCVPMDTEIEIMQNIETGEITTTAYPDASYQKETEIWKHLLRLRGNCECDMHYTRAQIMAEIEEKEASNRMQEQEIRDMRIAQWF